MILVICFNCAEAGRRSDRLNSNATSLRRAIEETLDSTSYRVILTQKVDGVTKSRAVFEHEQNEKTRQREPEAIEIGTDVYLPDSTFEDKYRLERAGRPGRLDIALVILDEFIARIGEVQIVGDDRFSLLLLAETNAQLTIKDGRVSRILERHEERADEEGPVNTFDFKYDQNVARITAPPPDRVISKN